MVHICVTNLSYYHFRNLQQYEAIHIQENKFENIVYNMAAILPRSQCICLLSCCDNIYIITQHSSALQWRHNGLDGVWNHRPHDCLLNRLFTRRSKKTSKLHVTGIRAGIHQWLVTHLTVHTLTVHLGTHAVYFYNRLPWGINRRAFVDI